MAVPSYAHGASAVPLLGETIGENLRRVVEQHGDREALVVRSQGYRATYRQLWEQTSQAARGLMARGVETGRPRRHLGPEPLRVGRRPVRHGADRRDPGQHQPGLQEHRAGVRPQPVRDQPAAALASVPAVRLRRDAGVGAGPLPDPARVDRAGRRLGRPARGRRARSRGGPGRARRRRSSSTTPSTSSTPPGRPASRRAPRSRTTTS